MDTQIRFLEELREDLTEVAWRETLGREPEARGRRARRDAYREPRRKLVWAAGIVAFLTLAGGIGWFVMRGSGIGPVLSQQELRAGSGPAEPPHALASPAPATIPGGVLGLPPGQRSTFSLGEEATAQSTAQGASETLAGITMPGDLTRIVKTGRLAVVVERDTFDDKFREAGLVATRYRGYIQSSSTRGERAGDLTIRVPVARFDAAMNELAALGRIESQSVAGKNVTAQFVDLNARLSVWQYDQRQLNELLAKATSSDQIIRYTNAIMEVQFRIEEIKGQLRVLKNEADMSTIKLSIRESGVQVAATETKVTNPSLRSAWAHAIAGFLGVVFAVTIGLGYLIPISVLLVVGWFVWRRARRRAMA